MPLFLVNRHIQAISSRQLSRVFGQCDQRSKMAMGELGDEVNEVPGKWSAMNCLLMFFTHEIANALKLIVNGSECRMVQEELIEAGAL